MIYSTCLQLFYISLSDLGLKFLKYGYFDTIFMKFSKYNVFWLSNFMLIGPDVHRNIDSKDQPYIFCGK